MSGIALTQPAQGRGHVNWLDDHAGLAWVGLALVLGAVEVATVDLVFAMLAGGALAGAVAAAAGGGLVAQVLAAVAVAMLLLGLVRPILRRRLYADGGTASLTGTAAHVGREALVIETVTATGGRIRLEGEVWSARMAPAPLRADVPADARPDPLARPDGHVPDGLLPGLRVRVTHIDGATAVVTPSGPEPELS